MTVKEKLFFFLTSQFAQAADERSADCLLFSVSWGVMKCLALSLFSETGDLWICYGAPWMKEHIINMKSQLKYLIETDFYLYVYRYSASSFVRYTRVFHWSFFVGKNSCVNWCNNFQISHRPPISLWFHCSPCWIHSAEQVRDVHQITLTCVVCGDVYPGDSTEDVKVLKQSYALWGFEVRGWPAESLHSGDGDSGLAGLQHHHHSINVRDGDTGVLPKTPTCTSVEKVKRGTG